MKIIIDSQIKQDQKPLRVGVISDTHVPDRVGSLHPDVLPIFDQIKVEHIIHAGDLSTPRVIDALRSIAPVSYAKGNRDWFNDRNHELVKFVTLNQVKIAITHGHGGFLPYFWDKIPYYLKGYRFERFVKRLNRLSGNARVIIFGHSHQVENRWVGKKLYFNSGSAYDSGNDGYGPTVGLIEIENNCNIKGRILPMRKGIWKKGKWLLEEEKVSDLSI
jgi:hypothetical protein